MINLSAFDINDRSEGLQDALQERDVIVCNEGKHLIQHSKFNIQHYRTKLDTLSECIQFLLFFALLAVDKAFDVIDQLVGFCFVDITTRKILCSF